MTPLAPDYMERRYEASKVQLPTMPDAALLRGGQEQPQDSRASLSPTGEAEAARGRLRQRAGGCEHGLQQLVPPFKGYVRCRVDEADRENVRGASCQAPEGSTLHVPKPRVATGAQATSADEEGQ